MSPVAGMQPMGIQVALQAEAQKAQIELTKAQTNSIKADTMKKVTADMANAGLELVGNMINNKKAGTDTKKAEQEIANLKKNNELIGEQISKIQNDNKISEFQIWINNIKKEIAEIQENGATLSYGQLFGMKELQGLKTELKELGVRFDEADFQQQRLYHLQSCLQKSQHFLDWHFY